LLLDDFYIKFLASSSIDTVGAITIIIGIAVKHGFSYFSLKALLLMGIMMAVNPLASHMIARSAYLSGYQAKEAAAVRGDADALANAGLGALADAGALAACPDGCAERVNGIDEAFPAQSGEASL